MDIDMQKLNKQERIVENTRLAFEGAAREATAHLAEASGMRHTVVMKQEELRAQARRLQKLKKVEAHLRTNQKQLNKKLHAVMDAKVAAARARLEEQQRKVKKLMKDLRALNATHEKYGKEAETKLKQRKRALETVREADAALVAAEKSYAKAAKEYRAFKVEENQESAAYKYTGERYKAAESRLLANERLSKKRAQSLEKLQGILDMEEGELKNAASFGESRLRRRIHGAEEAKRKTQRALMKARQEYSAWEKQQLERFREKESKKQEYEAALKSYVGGREQTLSNARAKAAATAEREHRWSLDDWAWAGPDGEEMDLADGAGEKANGERGGDDEADDAVESSHDAGGDAAASVNGTPTPSPPKAVAASREDVAGGEQGVAAWKDSTKPRLDVNRGASPNADGGASGEEGHDTTADMASGSGAVAPRALGRDAYEADYLRDNDVNGDDEANSASGITADSTQQQHQHPETDAMDADFLTDENGDGSGTEAADAGGSGDAV